MQYHILCLGNWVHCYFQFSSFCSNLLCCPFLFHMNFWIAFVFLWGNYIESLLPWVILILPTRKPGMSFCVLCPPQQSSLKNSFISLARFTCRWILIFINHYIFMLVISWFLLDFLLHSVTYFVWGEVHMPQQTWGGSRRTTFRVCSLLLPCISQGYLLLIKLFILRYS